MSYTDTDKLTGIALIVDSELAAIKEEIKLLEELGNKILTIIRRHWFNGIRCERLKEALTVS